MRHRNRKDIMKFSLTRSIIPLYLAAAVAALGSCAAARAAEPEVTVGVHVYTYHFTESAGFNNVNPGAYIVVNGWTGGLFYNSERHMSGYAGYTFRNVLGSPIDVVVGGVTGYAVAPVVPLVAPSVLVTKHLRLSLPLTPYKTGWGVHASLEF